MEFTSDWFSSHQALWSRLLLPMAGQKLRVLEVGSHEGRSAVWMLQNLLLHPESRLHCVDTWTDRRVLSRFRSNVAETGRTSQVVEHQGDSAEVLKRLSGDFDVIYIDGNHEARCVLTDAALAWSLLEPGGWLIFDDYGWNGPVEFLPRNAIDAFLQLWMTQIDVIHKGYQVFIRRRSGSPAQERLAIGSQC